MVFSNRINLNFWNSIPSAIMGREVSDTPTLGSPSRAEQFLEIISCVLELWAILFIIARWLVQELGEEDASL